MWKNLALTLLAVLVLAVAGVLALAAGRPDHFEVKRTLRLQAPAEKIHPLIHDMRAFNRWNPYAHKDPAMAGSYRGPAAGPGAAFDFAGGKSGSGSIQITGSTPPREVTMRLRMTEPFAADNAIAFSITPQAGGAHDVTWAMRGASPLLARAAGLFFSMDGMIGGDFEAGLAGLKRLAEQP